MLVSEWRTEVYDAFYIPFYNRFFIPLHSLFMFWIFPILINLFYVYPANCVIDSFNATYNQRNFIWNKLCDVHYWFFKIPIVWKLDDVIFNRNHCCECGKEINYDDIDIKVSTRAFKHNECFDYYSRSARE